MRDIGVTAPDSVGGQAVSARSSSGFPPVSSRQAAWNAGVGLLPS